jgi:hypothetical protein
VALDKEFPTKLNQDVRIILAGSDGVYFRACPQCSGRLDLNSGEWVADFPGRDTHGYRISQLISSRVEPGEILNEYRLTRFPSEFYNLKIGIPWADLQRRVDVSTVLSLCGTTPLEEKSKGSCYMGVDTGRALHVVILRPIEEEGDVVRHQLVHLAVCKEFSDLDALMERFNVERCVIDGQPETHSTRQFAERHGGQVYLCFFIETQRGKPKWDYPERRVRVNRTDALDASRAAVREKLLVLPRRQPLVETFARHMAADAKKLEEDAETGAQRFHYIKTGENHFSFAFTYAWMAASYYRWSKTLWL